ncbi:MAG: TMEM165/GDT1 family protein [Chloroflexi bacterium]|nr:MAG: TMEM165/GDT1 family protein [Chloroflexota bacterium]
MGLGLTVFTLIFLLELPDKTALAALVLATRHRPLPVFLGAAAAFVIQSAVAVAAGSLLGLLPREPIRIGAGVLFLVMATILVRQNLMKRGESNDQHELEREERRHRHPFVAERFARDQQFSGGTEWHFMRNELYVRKIVTRLSYSNLRRRSSGRLLRAGLVVGS